MSVTSGFFNSQGGDRKYDAIQLSSIFDGVITDGVFRSVGDGLLATAGSGLSVIVGVGRAWFNHTWTFNDAALPLTIDAADALFDRIDTIVLDVDTRTSIRANSILVVKGTPASTPVAPTLINTGGHYQYPLANIRLPKTMTSILPAYITKRIGTVDCPYVTVIDAATEIGNRTYTESNYVTSSESITESIDALDMAVKAGLDVANSGISTLGSTKQNNITGAASTVAGSNLQGDKVVITTAAGKLTQSPITVVELGYLAGLTGNVQTQLGALLGGTLAASKAVVTDAAGKLISSVVTLLELSYLSGARSNLQTQIDNAAAGVSNLTINRALVSNADGGIAVSPVTNVELAYLDGVTAAIQTQFNAKEATIDGTASTIAHANLTANRVLVTNGSGKAAVSSITDTLLGYLANLTGNIQTQLDGKLGASAQAVDSLKVGGKKITVGTSAPASPVSGDVWIDTN